MDEVDILWCPDGVSGRCMNCSTKFTLLTRRKHHCRSCGDLVCNECSKSRLRLTPLATTGVRVCKKCVRSVSIYQRAWEHPARPPYLTSGRRPAPPSHAPPSQSRSPSPSVSRGRGMHASTVLMKTYSVCPYCFLVDGARGRDSYVPAYVIQRYGAVYLQVCCPVHHARPSETHQEALTDTSSVGVAGLVVVHGVSGERNAVPIRGREVLLMSSSHLYHTLMSFQSPMSRLRMLHSLVHYNTPSAPPQSRSGTRSAVSAVAYGTRCRRGAVELEDIVGLRQGYRNTARSFGTPPRTGKGGSASDNLGAGGPLRFPFPSPVARKWASARLSQSAPLALNISVYDVDSGTFMGDGAIRRRIISFEKHKVAHGCRWFLKLRAPLIPRKSMPQLNAVLMRIVHWTSSRVPEGKTTGIHQLTDTRGSPRKSGASSSHSSKSERVGGSPFHDLTPISRVPSVPLIIELDYDRMVDLAKYKDSVLRVQRCFPCVTYVLDEKEAERCARELAVLRDALAEYSPISAAVNICVSPTQMTVKQLRKWHKYRCLAGRRGRQGGSSDDNNGVSEEAKSTQESKGTADHRHACKWVGVHPSYGSGQDECSFTTFPNISAIFRMLRRPEYCEIFSVIKITVRRRLSALLKQYVSDYQRIFPKDMRARSKVSASGDTDSAVVGATPPPPPKSPPKPSTPPATESNAVFATPPVPTRNLGGSGSGDGSGAGGGGGVGTHSKPVFTQAPRKKPAPPDHTPPTLRRHRVINREPLASSTRAPSAGVGTKSRFGQRTGATDYLLMGVSADTTPRSPSSPRNRHGSVPNVSRGNPESASPNQMTANPSTSKHADGEEKASLGDKSSTSDSHSESEGGVGAFSCESLDIVPLLEGLCRSLDGQLQITDFLPLRSLRTFESLMGGKPGQAVRHATETMRTDKDGQNTALFKGLGVGLWSQRAPPQCMVGCVLVHASHGGESSSVRSKRAQPSPSRERNSSRRTPSPQRPSPSGPPSQLQPITSLPLTRVVDVPKLCSALYSHTRHLEQACGWGLDICSCGSVPSADFSENQGLSVTKRGTVRMGPLMHHRTSQTSSTSRGPQTPQSPGTPSETAPDSPLEQETAPTHVRSVTSCEADRCGCGRTVLLTQRTVASTQVEQTQQQSQPSGDDSSDARKQEHTGSTVMHRSHFDPLLCLQCGALHPHSQRPQVGKAAVNATRVLRNAAVSGGNPSVFALRKLYKALTDAVSRPPHLNSRRARAPAPQVCTCTDGDGEKRCSVLVHAFGCPSHVPQRGTSKSGAVTAVGSSRLTRGQAVLAEEVVKEMSMRLSGKAPAARSIAGAQLILVHTHMDVGCADLVRQSECAVLASGKSSGNKASCGGKSTEGELNAECMDCI